MLLLLAEEEALALSEKEQFLLQDFRMRVGAITVSFTIGGCGSRDCGFSFSLKKKTAH